MNRIAAFRLAASMIVAAPGAVHCYLACEDSTLDAAMGSFPLLSSDFPETKQTCPRLFSDFHDEEEIAHEEDVSSIGHRGRGRCDHNDGAAG
jgi:hypothetical protein